LRYQKRIAKVAFSESLCGLAEMWEVHQRARRFLDPRAVISLREEGSTEKLASSRTIEVVQNVNEPAVDQIVVPANEHALNNS